MIARFKDKVVIVTGASRGIGGSVADAFHAEGARVIGVSRTGEQSTYEQMKYDLGNANAAQLRDLVNDIVSRYGKIDALVNNAGIIRRAPAVEFSEQDWDDVIRVNLTSPFFLTQAVAKWWLTGGGREKAGAGSRLKIVNIASMLSFQGGITIPAYTASKHGIAGVTKALANEWAPLGININAIAPGYISTENTRPLRENPERNTAIKARIPQGDWGEPQDISGAVMFLASNDADYVNGAVLNVDGGWLAR
jgi:2-deoxy-D-gluconate 3-dehydrogenase